MKETPISKSQERAIRLLGLTNAAGYAQAAEVLEVQGFRRDGLPINETWRSAAKLSDSELVAKLHDSRSADETEDNVIDGQGGWQ